MAFHPGIVPRRAIVRPRVLRPDGADLLLDDVVRSALKSGQQWRLVLKGGPGSGRSTALAHLAAEFAESPDLALIDDADPRLITPEMAATLDALRAHRILIAADTHETFAARSLPLAPWTQDDRIEFLLAEAPHACGPVLERLSQFPDADLTEGNPTLEVAAMTALANGHGAESMAELLRSLILERVPDREALRRARRIARRSFVRSLLPALKKRFKSDPELKRLLRIPAAAAIVVADELFAQLTTPGSRAAALTLAVRPPVLREAARLLRRSPEARARLGHLLSTDRFVHGAAALSLLAAASDSWVPTEVRTTKLYKTRAPRANWPGAKLRGTMLARADFSHATLTGADFSRCQLFQADFHGADLAEADFTVAAAQGADLSGCNLRRASLERTILRTAKLKYARLDGATLADADLDGADLQGAVFDRANLRGADLLGCHLLDASFRGADCSRAQLQEARLADADWHGATLQEAGLSGADLSELRWPGAMLPSARLEQADLTGAYLPGTDLRGASLMRALVADVDLSNSDLRDANFSGAVFHMGSSRSGLVFSEIASEGSRTGFYTDDPLRGDYQDPAEIRAANLTRADLRGALVEHTDWYLVDLRGARYTPEQEAHFRGTGAILGQLV